MAHRRPGDGRRRHRARVAERGIAAEAGRWLIEIYDPAAPGDRAYVRFGPAASAAIMAAGPVPCDFTLLTRPAPRPTV